MTADEVLQAIQWHSSEADRLRAEVEPWTKVANALEAGRMDEVPDLPPDKFRAAGEKFRKAADAAQRVHRLMELVAAQMPLWKGGTMPLGKALHRWWSAAG
jgi:hypothetical protein